MKNLFCLVSAICFLMPLLGYSEYNHVELLSKNSSGSKANAAANNPTISGDGRYVAFDSMATNLTSGENADTNDVFLVDRQSDTLSLISKNATTGIGGNGSSSKPVLSENGAYIVFESVATNLNGSSAGNATSDIYRYNVATQGLTLISADGLGAEANGDSNNPVLSEDGRYVAFDSEASDLIAGDGNGMRDVFVRDTVGGTTIAISRIIGSGLLATDGESRAPHISDDGRYIVYESTADLYGGLTPGRSRIFLRDTVGAVTEVISQNDSNFEADADSFSPRISGDGRYILFLTAATNLDVNDMNGITDLYIRDRMTATTRRVSFTSTDGALTTPPTTPDIDDDGTFACIDSTSDELVNNDSNEKGDVIAIKLATLDNKLISTKSTGGPANDNSAFGRFSPDARHWAFLSKATNLDGGTGGITQVFYANKECALGLTAITDTDSDGTLDCNEDCGNDPLKTVAGVCGCNVADTDTDGDGTKDCNDGCPTDAAKISEGSCGCGTLDSDNNNNGVTDCLDISSSIVPEAPILKALKPRGHLRIFVTLRYSAVEYNFTVRAGGSTIKTFSTTKTRFTIRVPRRRLLRVSYNMSIPAVGVSPGITTMESAEARIRV